MDATNEEMDGFHTACSWEAYDTLKTKQGRCFEIDWGGEELLNGEKGRGREGLTLAVRG